MIRRAVIVALLMLAGAGASAHDGDDARFRVLKFDNSSVVIFDRFSGAFITCGVGVQGGIGYSIGDVDAPSGVDQQDVDALVDDAGNPVRIAGFDAKYGAGSARRILENAPRALGTLENPAPGTCFGWRRPPGTAD